MRRMICYGDKRRDSCSVCSHKGPHEEEQICADSLTCPACQEVEG